MGFFPPYSLMPDFEVNVLFLYPWFSFLGYFSTVFAHVVNSNLFPLCVCARVFSFISPVCFHRFLLPLYSPVHSLSVLLVCTALYFFHLSQYPWVFCICAVGILLLLHRPSLCLCSRINGCLFSLFSPPNHLLFWTEVLSKLSQMSCKAKMFSPP